MPDGFATTHVACPTEAAVHEPDRYLTYALITPVRNESEFIGLTIRSVVRQTRRPVRWVIVDDGSTDETAEIVRRLSADHDWIELIQMPRRTQRSFAAKVHGFNAGYDHVKHLAFDVIGNLDGDISFGEDYLAYLLEKFEADPELGVTGTVFREKNYSSDLDSFEGRNHVAGGCQLFRRRCFEEVGGFIPNHCGGVDWIAVTTARMLGWKTRSFKEKWFFHHRPLGRAGRSGIGRAFAYGQKDYYLGGHPVWEVCRVVYRMTRKPYFVEGVALGAGYASLLMRRAKRPVSQRFVEFHRSEQMNKLRRILSALFRLRRIDPFEVASD
jgi:biofilm PGA synthesis N-glycosyltransferase PgaC